MLGINCVQHAIQSKTTSVLGTTLAICYSILFCKEPCVKTYPVIVKKTTTTLPNQPTNQPTNLAQPCPTLPNLAQPTNQPTNQPTLRTKTTWAKCHAKKQAKVFQWSLFNLFAVCFRKAKNCGRLKENCGRAFGLESTAFSTMSFLVFIVSSHR